MIECEDCREQEEDPIEEIEFFHLVLEGDVDEEENDGNQVV